MRPIKKKRKILACKICNKKTHYISQNGLCEKCMINKIKSVNLQMLTKEGPAYDKWKIKLQKYLGIE